MKQEKRNAARMLRFQGQSIKLIAKQLQVSPASVSTWVKDILLTQEQEEILKSKNPIYNAQLNGSKIFATQKREQRKKYQEEGRDMAKKLEPLHIKGCMLYWAEGTKNQNSCIFTNSDVTMIKLFLKFVKNYFDISDDQISLYLNCYVTPARTIQMIERYWLDNLTLPRSCVRKHVVKHEKLVDKNKLPHGVCTVRCGNVQVVQHIFGAIGEYVGINDYCLDGKYGATAEN